MLKVARYCSGLTNGLGIRNGELELGIIFPNLKTDFAVEELER
jgi:hypothetical protein